MNIFKRLSQFLKSEENRTKHLYQPETNSHAVRQLVKIRNEVYLDEDVTASAAITIAKNLDEILKYIDNVEMDLPRYGV